MKAISPIHHGKSKFNFRFCLFLSYVCFFLINLSCKESDTSHAEEEGFQKVFNGENLDGWEGDSTYWRVEDENLVGEVTPETILDRNSFIIWQGDMPTNFELKVEYRISAEGNSGINYRSEKVEEVPYALRGYQADLNGPKLSYGKFTGSNYEERRRTTLASQGEKVVLPSLENADSLKLYSSDNMWTARNVVGSLGSLDSLRANINEGWNEYHLIVDENHMKHYINGTLMSDVTDNDTVNRRFDGLLGVQVHVGPPMKVEYRNFRIKEIE